MSPPYARIWWIVSGDLKSALLEYHTCFMPIQHCIVPENPSSATPAYQIDHGKIIAMIPQEKVRSLATSVVAKFKKISGRALLILGFVILLSLIIHYSSPVTSVRADEIDDLQKQIDQLNKAREMSVNATKPLEGQLSSLRAQLNRIQANLNALAGKISQREKDIAAREEKIARQQVLLNARIREYYIRSFDANPLIVILSAQGSGAIFRELVYRLAASQEDQRVIASITQDVTDLVAQKDKLEKDKASLSRLQAQVDKNAKFLDGEIAKAKAYQVDLSNQIASLTAKQQALIAAKLASLNIPLYAYSTQGGCSSDISPYKDPGFDGAKFGFFTYGVPNRVGLNQYGALGRAKAGQGSDAILRAYYNFDGYQSVSATIKVNNGDGYNTGSVIWTGSLEDYVKRIYEVPDSWIDNDLAALKAQAVAARSFAMAQTDNGSKSICATQRCQVFKTDPKGGNWEKAVNATSGQVMMKGGSPITAYFSSTHGGYFYNTADIGWSSTPYTKRGQDTNGSVGSFGDLNSKAYDKDSPWFYCDWGGRSQYNKTAWLTSAEVADIVNSILLVQNNPAADPHILQTDKGDSEAWNEDKVRQELSKYRTSFTSISSVSVEVDFGSGQVTTVRFAGDGGSADFASNTFRKYFNLRAPSNIQVVGPLYNVEKR